MKTYLIAALSLALTACAGSSPRIDPARLNELQKGQTTVAEVVRQFGRPSVLLKNPSGTQTAIYVHNDGQSGTTMVPLVAIDPADSVTFYFDTNGVLTDYKTTQAKASRAVSTESAGTMQPSSEKPAQANTARTAPADSDKATPTNTGKTTQTNTDKATQTNTDKATPSKSWFPDILIPSATKQNR